MLTRLFAFPTALRGVRPSQNSADLERNEYFIFSGHIFSYFYRINLIHFCVNERYSLADELVR